MRDAVQPGANAPRGPDQQRDVRLHRRVRAAVRHQPDPGHGARPLGRPRLDRRGQSALITPDGTAHQADLVVHAGGPVRAGRAHRGTVADAGRPVAGVCRGLASRLLRCSVGWLRRRAARVERRQRRTSRTRRTHEDDRRRSVSRPPGWLVLIPTYNERENLPRIVARVRAAVPAADVLVLDDNSPDGTGEIADELAAADPQVHVAAPRRASRAWARPTSPASRWALDRGLRRRRRDGRGRLAPARAAARRCSPPLSDADLVIGVAVGPRRRGASTGRCTARSSRVGAQRLHPGPARHAGPRRDRRATASTARAPCATMDLDRRRSRRATASRST